MLKKERGDVKFCKKAYIAQRSDMGVSIVVGIEVKVHFNGDDFICLGMVLVSAFMARLLVSSPSLTFQDDWSTGLPVHLGTLGGCGR